MRICGQEPPFEACYATLMFEKLMSKRRDKQAICFRQADRRPVNLRGFALGGGVDADVVLTDLSYEGCRVTSSEPLKVGQTVDLRIIGRGRSVGRVRWARDSAAGLSFDASEHQLPSTPKPEAQEQVAGRKAERLQITTEVTLRRSMRPGFAVRTIDLTRFGCRVEFVERPKVDEQVWVKLPGLDSVEAEVRWLGESSGGLQFRKPVHPAVFDLVLARAR